MSNPAATTRSSNNLALHENLTTFMSFLCNGQKIDMSTAIKSSLGLFQYCPPSREAVLTFYSELFEEYSTHYWLSMRNLMPVGGTSTNVNRKPIEFVGRLTKCFYDVAKTKTSTKEHQPPASLDISSVPISNDEVVSPTKSASSIAGPASPTTSQTCSSPSAAPKIIPTTSKISSTSRRTSSCNSSKDIEQTPMSPTTQDVELATLGNECSQLDQESHVFGIFEELKHLIAEIKSILDNLNRKYDLKKKDVTLKTLHINSVADKQQSKLKEVLNCWATDLLVSLIIKQQELAKQVKSDSQNTEPSKLLAKNIELWLGNPVNSLLIDLLFDTHDDIPALFKHLELLSSTQHCDWLLAHILLEISERPNFEKDFSSCMEYLIGCQTAKESVTHILAHLSDTNPKALANFPKSNILFLISLCQTSSSLLNIIAQEIPDKIDVDFLNKLAKEAFNRSADRTNPLFINSLAHCIMAAPNSYKLFLLALEIRMDGRVNEEVKSAAILTIEAISAEMHKRAVTRMAAQQNIMLSNQQVHLIDNLLEQIGNDLNKLIERCPTSSLVEKSANEIFYTMSLIYGHFFASKVICHYLNLQEEVFWPLLKPLLKKLMKLFGDDGSVLVSQTLSLDSHLRTSNYWKNIDCMTRLLPELKLDLDLISQLLIDKLSAAKFDIVPVAHLIKLCCKSLERVPHGKICISTKHRLCMSLATCFFLLLEYESDNFQEILSYIGISLNCMALLKQSCVASHILCRALLKRSLVYGNLFNENFSPDLVGDGNNSLDWTQEDSIKLSKENLKVTLGHRFRRLPNQIPEHVYTRKQKHIIKYSDAQETDEDNSKRPNKVSINCYLLIEAFKSSINNIEAFANLFVDFHCPVMFDKHSWPSDEALRIINERNLSILRKFEQVPPLWDLFELIGQAGCLKSCLVLVKALLAAHLALWASATTNSAQDRLISTSRLIPPLAHSNLIPKAFGLAVEVFPHLTPGEVYAVICDIWQYLKDTNSNGVTAHEDKRNYLNRLRLFMCQRYPGSLYVKIFKSD